MIHKPSKLDQTDLVLVCDQSSSVGLSNQDYKSHRCSSYNNNNNNPICKAPECQKTSMALICATLVNTQTHRQTHTQQHTN